MADVIYPFVTFVDSDGVPLRPPSTYLPVQITNPHSGLSAIVYALVDTGADQCTFPEALAVDLGRDFRADGVQSESTLGVSGATEVFIHTFDLAILSPDRRDVFASFESVSIACVPTDIPPLLGVADCLNAFVLTIDYPGMEMVLQR